MNDLVELYMAALESLIPAEVKVASTALENRRAWDRRRKAMLPKNWDAMTAYVFRRDNYTCRYCDDTPDKLHCDHMIPLSRGGLNEFDNLTTSCGPCNLDKGSKLISEWKYYQMGGFE